MLQTLGIEPRTIWPCVEHPSHHTTVLLPAFCHLGSHAVIRWKTIQKFILQCYYYNLADIFFEKGPCHLSRRFRRHVSHRAIRPPSALLITQCISHICHMFLLPERDFIGEASSLQGSMTSHTLWWLLTQQLSHQTESWVWAQRLSVCPCEFPPCNNSLVYISVVRCIYTSQIGP